MRSLKAAALLLTISLIAGPVSAGVDIGLSVDKDGISGFYLAIGDHYTVSEKEVVKIRKHNIPDEDLSVVFFLARHANTRSDVIIKLRLQGKSWMDIALHFGLSSKIFYVELKDPGPPYGKAWGHKKNKKHNWKKIRFSDDEITAYVNLKFISSHYGYSTDEVARMRSKGTSFVNINTKLKKERKAKTIAAKDKSERKSKGKGKNKGR